MTMHNAEISTILEHYAAMPDIVGANPSGQARRGAPEKDDVINTRSLAELRQPLK